MTRAELWDAVNRDLVAKAIGELTYEELLDPVRLEGTRHALELASGVTYRFDADASVWPWLRVAPGSLTRDGQAPAGAVQLLTDAREELGLDGLVLGNLTEEIQNTLYCEMHRRARLEKTTAGELIGTPQPLRETHWDGHPKILANKGRLGWGRREISRYAPEAGRSFQLAYLGVRRSTATLRLAEDVHEQALLDESLPPDDRERVIQRLEAEGASLETHLILPVHPWQLERFIVPQYAEAIARGELVELGTHGDAYLPRQSIRTLANADRLGRQDLKLPVTILNTSCYRGLPGEHLATGVELSRWLRRRVDGDPSLSDRLIVLADSAGVHVPHPRQERIEGTPYRYREMLGAIWREPLIARLADDQRGLLVSALSQTDGQGRSIVGALVDRSPLEAEAWLRRLFEVTTIPLYHLMCAHGVGLIAHGQNLALILEGGTPVTGVVKDVHGDLRLVDETLASIATLDEHARSTVTRLPPEHLILDLVTSHLVTTLRFIAPHLEREHGVPEPTFYHLLAETLRAYQDDHPDLADRFDTFDLLADEFDRVLLNKVRFEQGYQDRAQRPLPQLGTPMSNPLAVEAPR